MKLERELQKKRKKVSWKRGAQEVTCDLKEERLPEVREYKALRRMGTNWKEDQPK